MLAPWPEILGTRVANENAGVNAKKPRSKTRLQSTNTTF